MRIDGNPCQSCAQPTSDAGLYCAPCRADSPACPEAFESSSLVVLITNLIAIRNNTLTLDEIRSRIAVIERQARSIFEMQQRRHNDAGEGAECA